MRTFHIVLVAAMLGSVAAFALADRSGYANGPHTPCRSHCGRCPICPKCSNKVCRLEVTHEKEKKSCFEVECKEICVPKITLPCWWDAIPFLRKSDSGCGAGKCCEPRCAKTKVVKVLKKRDYECDKCGYRWNLEDATGCAPCDACISHGHAQPPQGNLNLHHTSEPSRQRPPASYFAPPARPR